VQNCPTVELQVYGLVAASCQHDDSRHAYPAAIITSSSSQLGFLFIVGGVKSYTINQSINQSKFIFQVITEELQYKNVVALERLPEKHYAH